MTEVGAVHLTSDIAGIGGRIRSHPQDFVVVEELRRVPSGRGEYAWARIEKTGISTPRLVRELGAMLRIKSHEIHPAGFKDADAVTTQWVALPFAASKDLKSTESIRVLEVQRDHEPLHADLIARNRFTITIREADDTEAARQRAHSILGRIEQSGLPNRYGPQRFGVRGESAIVGAALLRRDDITALDWILGHPSPKEGDPRARVFREAYESGDYATALRSCPGNLRLEHRLLERLAKGAKKSNVAREIPRQERRFYASALQSELFNRVLAARMEKLAQRLDRVFSGDLLIDELAGSTRIVRDPSAESESIRDFRASPSGPLFGTQCSLAEGDPGALERAVLTASGFDREAFARIPDLALEGKRRSLRVRVSDVRISHPGENRVALEFALPAGAFATSLLSEVMKTPESA